MSETRTPRSSHAVLSILFLLALFSCTQQSGRVYEVQTAEGLAEALAGAQPGDSILLADGSYDLNGDLILDQSGTADRPIVIRAKNRGEAVITGPTRLLLIGGEHIVVEGLAFRGTVGPAVYLQGCQHVRITRNTFELTETTRSSWVMVSGIPDDTTRFSGWNRIDHNSFENKTQLGNYITIEGTMTAEPRVSRADLIDHNLFANIGPRAENALEAIRIGSSQYTLSSGGTILEYNLFEQCDGDPEYISVKSSDDTVRFNTFRECLGTLSLRHGNGSVVHGNFILGNGRTGSFLDSTGRTWTLGTGGIRWCGSGMKITDNYLEGLVGTEWDAAMAVIGGDAEYGDGQSLTKHFRIRDAHISGNVLVNNTSGFEFGYDGGGFQGNWWPMAPTRLVVEKNVIVGDRGMLIRFFNPPTETVWKDNIAWATKKARAAAAPIDGVAERDPGLVRTGNVWHLPGNVPERQPLNREDVGPWAE